MNRTTALTTGLGIVAASAALSKIADAAPASVMVQSTPYSLQSVADPKSVDALSSSPGFCAGWPTAKPVLQQIADTLTGPWSFLYKGVIAVIIGIGDSICPTPPSP